VWAVNDIIAAVSTPPGDGARAIVRLAGEGVEALLQRLIEADEPGFPASASGHARTRLVHGRLAGDGLAAAWGAVPVGVLFWPGCRGPVGMPLAELQLPASMPLADAVVAEACRLGARLARGGEFTLRAFLAGRLDLLQAEAVLSVVDARSPDQLAAALDRMGGGAGRRLRGIYDDLLDLLADIEAAIDFADETTPDAVPTADAAARRSWSARLTALEAALADASAMLDDRTAVNAVPRAVLLGPPNIGKSSLFNALLGRDAALVADEAGTTRDWLEARLEPEEPDAAACDVVDLAGVEDDSSRASSDPLTEAAMEAARREVDRAAIVVVCREATCVSREGRPSSGLEVATAADQLPVNAMRIEVLTRCDRLSEKDRALLASTRGIAIATSSRTGEGLGLLRASVTRAAGRVPPQGSAATLRLAVGLRAACEALGPARQAAARAASGGMVDEALLAGQVRAAVEALGEVTGAVIGPELLDRIFARHCIGK
jgi:tRNA modification GTPase